MTATVEAMSDPPPLQEQLRRFGQLHRSSLARKGAAKAKAPPPAEEELEFQPTPAAPEAKTREVPELHDEEILEVMPHAEPPETLIDTFPFASGLSKVTKEYVAAHPAKFETKEEPIPEPDKKTRKQKRGRIVIKPPRKFTLPAKGASPEPSRLHTCKGRAHDPTTSAPHKDDGYYNDVSKKHTPTPEDEASYAEQILDDQDSPITPAPLDDDDGTTTVPESEHESDHHTTEDHPPRVDQALDVLLQKTYTSQGVCNRLIEELHTGSRAWSTDTARSHGVLLLENISAMTAELFRVVPAYLRTSLYDDDSKYIETMIQTEITNIHVEDVDSVITSNCDKCDHREALLGELRALLQDLLTKHKGVSDLVDKLVADTLSLGNTFALHEPDNEKEYASTLVGYQRAMEAAVHHLLENTYTVSQRPDVLSPE